MARIGQRTTDNAVETASIFSSMSNQGLVFTFATVLTLRYRVIRELGTGSTIHPLVKSSKAQKSINHQYSEAEQYK